MAKTPSSKKKSPVKKKKVRVAPAGESSAFRQQGIPTRREKAELKYVPWNRVELEQLNPLLQRQFIVGRDIMIARVLLKKGCIVPEHSHVNEQVTYILDGALKFWIDGKEIVVNAGEVLTIPPNMPHKAEALADTIDLDVFNPPRRDWMEKDDRYLRATK
ncbi:MAG TPA: cupin domain-containing protein [Terriglobales bacterium]|nr:cupin domain-containing protein [Terriglobales bacterium]